MSKSLYGDVHNKAPQNRPSDKPRRKAVLVHTEGTLFVRPARKGGVARPADGYLQEVLFTEGLSAVRSLGQKWFEGFVNKEANSG